jgi:hypothetical protein
VSGLTTDEALRWANRAYAALLAEMRRQHEETKQIREQASLLRHYVGTIANRVGRPTTVSALRRIGDIEQVGEGVLAELERLRTEVQRVEHCETCEHHDNGLCRGAGR